MSRLSTGKLDRRVTILRKGAGADNGYTVKAGGFAELATRWASVVPVTGKERIEAGGVSASAELTIWMRWDSVTAMITEKDGVRYQGKDYELVGTPIEIGTREGVELVVKRTRLPGA